MTKIVIVSEIDCNGEFCGECVHVTRTFFDTPWCGFFDVRLFKNTTGEEKRCQRCIDAEIGDLL